jgi:creatinine amidohydrolase
MHAHLQRIEALRVATLTSAEFDAARRQTPGIIVPIGSIEQHGPIGLLGCDALCAETVAEEAGRLGNILVAPVIAYTSSQFNMAFPGTISIRSRTVMSLIEDIIESLYRQDIRGIYFLNGHGANIAPVRTAMPRRLSVARTGGIMRRSIAYDSANLASGKGCMQRRAKSQ